MRTDGEVKRRGPFRDGCPVTICTAGWESFPELLCCPKCVHKDISGPIARGSFRASDPRTWPGCWIADVGLGVNSGRTGSSHDLFSLWALTVLGHRPSSGSASQQLFSISSLEVATLLWITPSWGWIPLADCEFSLQNFSPEEKLPAWDLLFLAVLHTPFRGKRSFYLYSFLGAVFGLLLFCRFYIFKTRIDLLSLPVFTRVTCVRTEAETPNQEPLVSHSSTILCSSFLFSLGLSFFSPAAVLWEWFWLVLVQIQPLVPGRCKSLLSWASW